MPERRSKRLADLTGDQSAAALAERPVLLLPLGSHESHGPSLPMGDYVLADQLALMIADQTTAPCLVAPVLPFGGADYFGSVPGGIALRQATLRAVLTDMLDALLRHHLNRVIILNGHGGNCQAIHEVTLAVRRQHGVIIPSLYLWKVARALMDRLPGITPAGRAGHGADPLASIALHLRNLPAPAPRPHAEPRRVLGLPATDFATVDFAGLPIDMPLELDEIAPDGIAPNADPARASAEDGRILTEWLVKTGAALAAHVAVSG